VAVFFSRYALFIFHDIAILILKEYSKILQFWCEIYFGTMTVEFV
jgi:hypothetical protein